MERRSCPTLVQFPRNPNLNSLPKPIFDPLQLNRDAITLGRGETDRMKLNEGHARSEDDEARGRHASAQLKQEAG